MDLLFCMFFVSFHLDHVQITDLWSSDPAYLESGRTEAKRGSCCSKFKHHPSVSLHIQSIATRAHTFKIPRVFPMHLELQNYSQ